LVYIVLSSVRKHSDFAHPPRHLAIETGSTLAENGHKNRFSSVYGVFSHWTEYSSIHYTNIPSTLVFVLRYRHNQTESRVTFLVSVQLYSILQLSLLAATTTRPLFVSSYNFFIRDYKCDDLMHAFTSSARVIDGNHLYNKNKNSNVYFINFF